MHVLHVSDSANSSLVALLSLMEHTLSTSPAQLWSRLTQKCKGKALLHSECSKTQLQNVQPGAIIKHEILVLRLITVGVLEQTKGKEIL